jgi:S1-C subfamily serine protease
VRRAYLGISAHDLPLARRIVRHFDLSQESGARVDTVIPDSPAARAGIKVDDIIIALGDDPVRGVDELQRLLTGGRIGDTLQAIVLRRDRRLTLSVTPRESIPSG